MSPPRSAGGDWTMLAPSPAHLSALSHRKAELGPCLKLVLHGLLRVVDTLEPVVVRSVLFGPRIRPLLRRLDELVVELGALVGALAGERLGIGPGIKVHHAVLGVRFQS